MHERRKNPTRWIYCILAAFIPHLYAQTTDPALNALIKKGLITREEAQAALTETTSTNSFTQAPALNALVKKGILTTSEAQDAWADAQPPTEAFAATASKWRVSKAIKDIELFGDARLRYDNRSAENAPDSGASGSRYERDRFRYAIRAGIRGDVYDDFYYGLRLETSSNPRSPWVTFGDDSNPAPFAKNSDGVNIGQAYLGWRPTDWYEMTFGKMPMPLIITPMIWDLDISPEGAFEKFKTSVGNLDLAAQFGQFVYQDTNPDAGLVTSDTFLLAWQLAATLHLNTNMSMRLAPVLYNYTGRGSLNGLNRSFTGQGFTGLNTNTAAAYNQTGINDLLVLETPFEFNYHFEHFAARLFGDFAWNFEGASRARAAAAAAEDLDHAYISENMAFQVGAGFGNLGLVYGQTVRKNTWEARVYWQHVEQYAADVNLLDSDFFEGRGNLEGIYSAFAWSFTDAIIGTVRYGYANRINSALGTGGTNPDLPVLNPIRNYHIVQVDLTYKF